MAPGAAPAVYLAEAMVQQHIAGAGVERALIAADHGIEAEDRLDEIAVEPEAEQIAGALGEQVDQRLPRRPVEPHGPRRQGDRRDRIGGRADAGRRGAPGEPAQQVGRPLDRRAIGGERVGIAGRQPGHLGVPFGRVIGHQEARSVRLRQEVGGPAMDDLEAVPGQIEIAEDAGIEQADGVGGQRVAEAGVEFGGGDGAADRRPALQHPHGQAGPCQIGGRDEAVMAAADDHHVERFGHSVTLGRGTVPARPRRTVSLGRYPPSLNRPTGTPRRRSRRRSDTPPRRCRRSHRRGRPARCPRY